MRRRRVSFSSDPRWTALKRAGLAVMVALALLLAMLWFGESGQPGDSPPSPRVASGAASGAPEQPGTPSPENDVPILLPSDTVAEAVAQTDAEPDAAAQTDVAADKAGQTPEPAKPSSTVAEEKGQAPGETSIVRGGEGAASAGATSMPEPRKVRDAPSKPGRMPTPAKSPGAEAPEAPVPLQDGYFVQLGVFDDTDKSRKVVENASALGLPVHIQSRVVVGPFRNKREAEAARSRLKGVAEGTILPPQNTVKAGENPKAKSKSRRRAK
jgi:cell division protein FtsN